MPVQTQIIDAVNKVLGRNSTSLKFNEGGVCAGLAELYVKYTLSGKKKEFFQLSKKLAVLPEDYQFGQDSVLDNFISEIEREFNRFYYTRGQTFQGDMDDEFIDGKPIRKEFSLGLVESQANWSNVLEQIKNDGRSCFIGSHNHAIAISFVNNQYEVYDPNYDEDNVDAPNAIETNTRKFATAAEVIKELSQQFGYSQDGAVGLEITVYAHPNETKPATYPDKSALLKKSLVSKTDFQRDNGIEHPHRKYNSLHFAIYANDRDTIEYYLQNHEFSLINCGTMMLMDTNNDLVYSIYVNEPSKVNKETLIAYSIEAGNSELFLKMISDYQKNYVTTDPERKEFKSLLRTRFNLLLAAQSANPACILQILELYKNNGISLSDISQNELIKVVTQLTKNGDSELLNQFVKAIPLVYRAIILAGISSAIEHDKQGALRIWLETLGHQTKMVNNTLITSNLINKVSLLNFQQLIQSGFVVDPSLFSEALKRNRIEFFELSVASNANSVWSEFIQKLKDKTLQEPIDLFTSQEGTTKLQVLMSYKENDLIIRNWPDSVPAEKSIEALKFACECGNKVMVEFLSKKGVRVPTEFQVKQIEDALKANDHSRLDATLSSSIDYVQFFTKPNEELIKKLIKNGRYEFIINSWMTYKSDQQSTQPLGENNLRLGDLLWTGVTVNNKGLYEFIAKEAPDRALGFIKTIIDGNMPDNYIYAIKLAMALPGSTAASGSSSLYQFIREEMKVYDQLLFERQTKDDPDADKKFRKEARQIIQPLCNLVIYALENHYFSFAEQVNPQVPLSIDDLYDLFVKANKTGNQKTLEFLLANYPNLSANKEVYLKLAESKEFDLLALLFNQGKLIDNTIYIPVLKAAVRAHHEPVIKLLSAHINSAYKMEGSPLYAAISEGNKEGCILLLKYGANIPSNELFMMAIKQDDDRLLHAALQNPQFIEDLKRNETKFIDLLFSDGSSAALMYFYKYKSVYLEEQKDFFDRFLNYAISSDDVSLFKQLQNEEQFKALDKRDLFIQACHAEAPAIVNELLQYPRVVPAQLELSPLLDKLFGVDSKETEKDAHSIYDLIYKKALNRLYELVIKAKYRPFASMFKSIGDMVQDPGLSEFQKNHLITRAFMEGDQDVLNALLRQVQIETEVNQKVISLFTENLDKPQIIQVLLNNYTLEDVLTKALELEQWSVIVTLLKGRSVDELDPTLIAELKKHDTALFKEISTEAQKNYARDPRHELNQLLIIENKLALSTILEGQKTAIQDSIMSIQKLMEENKIDLKRNIYRFDLYDEIALAQKAMDELIPKMEQFYERNKGSTLQAVIADEANRNELWEFKKVMDAHGLAPRHFDEGDDLENAFKALKAFDKEQEALLQVQDEDAMLQQNAQEEQAQSSQVHESPSNPLSWLVLDLKQYVAQREQENYTHHLIPIFQYTKTEKTDAATNFINAIKDPRLMINERNKEILSDGRLCKKIEDHLAANKDEIQSYFDLREPVTNVSALISIMNERDPIAKLTHQLQHYHDNRSQGPNIYHLSIFTQFTKTDKLNAVSHLMDRLNKKDGEITEKDVAVLKQGSLGTMVSNFIKNNKGSLAQALGTEKINNIDDLVSACNQNKEASQNKM